MYRFPGRAAIDRLLVLPLAVPTYIAAYCYADLLDYAGPIPDLHAARLRLAQPLGLLVSVNPHRSRCNLCHCSRAVPLRVSHRTRELRSTIHLRARSRAHAWTHTNGCVLVSCLAPRPTRTSGGHGPCSDGRPQRSRCCSALGRANANRKHLRDPGCNAPIWQVPPSSR